MHEGEALFEAGETRIEAAAGDIVVVPAGMVHGFVNSGDGRLRMTCIHNSPESVQTFSNRD